MPDAAGRLQDVTLTETKLFHHLIHGIDNRWRRVKSGQGAFSCGSVFLRRQDVFQHPELCLPRTCSLIKGFGNTAPAHIFREDDLLVRCGEAVFFLTPFQDGDRRIVAVKAFFLVDLLDLVRSKVKGMTVCHWDFGMNIKGLHPAFLRLLPNRGKGCFHPCQFFLGEINKVVKGQCLQSFFGQFFKGCILFTADDFSIHKGFDAKIHKIDPCLYFVLVVLSSGVGNTHICKVGVVRTILTLIFLTTKIVNQPLRRIKGGFGTINGRNPLKLFQIVVCLPFAGKLLANALLVYIDCAAGFIPDRIAVFCFNDGKSFHKIGDVDDLKALGRGVKLGDKVVGDGTAVFVLIQNNGHRDTVVVFLLDVLLELIRTGVLDAFTDLAVRAEIVDPADRFGLDGCFLRGGNHGAGNALAVLNGVDRYIVPSVGQHCKVGFQAVLREAAHFDTAICAQRTAG